MLTTGSTTSSCILYSDCASEVDRIGDDRAALLVGFPLDEPSPREHVR